MKVQFAASAMIVVIVSSGCGRQTTHAQDNATPTPTTQASNEAKKNDGFPAEIAKSLPEASIVRVPVDAQGMEQGDKSEFRLVQAAPAKVNETSVDAAFARSSAPQKTADELDSSVESWGSHRGGGYGNGGGYGRGGYSGYYYNSYRPTYGYYGSYYSYYTPQYYYYSGYNYYYYPRTYCGSCCSY